MSLPAITFYTFLNEAYRLDAAYKLSMMSVIAYPDLDESGRNDLTESYRKAAQSPLELIDDLTYNDYSGIEQLKIEFDRTI